MELTYTCEKSEKETVALAMHPFRRYFRTVFIIAAVLEKAGLKRMGVSKARRFAYGATWVMLAFIVFGAVFNIHRSWMTLRWHILGIELKRQLHK